MAQENRTELKTYFETGDTPTEDEFIDLIDSSVNIDEDIVNGTEKPVPVDADKFSLWDSVAGALKTLTLANLKTAIGGGGGDKYQLHELEFTVDTTNTTQWHGTVANGATPWKFNNNSGVLLTSSMLSVSSGELFGWTRLGMAIANQTIESLLLQDGLNGDITHLSIIKARFNSTYTAITSIAILYEQAITLSGGYLSLTAADFTETAITEKDLIFMAVGASTSGHQYPYHVALNCKLD